MDIGMIIGIILGSIGAISSAWFILDKLVKRKNLTWRFAQKAVLKIADRMTYDNFSPTLLVGIGRGGAIMGAMISGALGHRPLIVIDRKYEWRNGRRMDDMIHRLRIDFSPEKVLLVAGEVHTGNTMRLYYDYLKSMCVKEIRRATLYYENGSIEPVEYKGIISSNKKLRLPWMFTKKYRREDRREEEFREL
ncbi:MAG: hypothetical protein KAW56_11205 [Candidatus Marinimicrobia bacterium]|nr:hypothetical protein [Candidatus Neomarinimicrobiota bacterium]